VKIDATSDDIRALLDLSVADEDAREDRHRSRESVARRLPPELLQRYEVLRGSGRRPVVAAIEQGRCSGCHVRLPTVLEQRARAAPAIYGCPHCRRMLYAPEMLRLDRPQDRGASRRAERFEGRHS
jgi:predicted  nucleic acid-binding Zn-ribbon protein